MNETNPTPPEDYRYRLLTAETSLRLLENRVAQMEAAQLAQRTINRYRLLTAETSLRLLENRVAQMEAAQLAQRTIDNASALIELRQRVQDLEDWRRRAVALAAVAGLRLDVGVDGVFVVDELTPAEATALGGVPQPRPIEEEG